MKVRILVVSGELKDEDVYFITGTDIANKAEDYLLSNQSVVSDNTLDFDLPTDFPINAQLRNMEY